jgi:uncharacterized protein (TIGR02118 family)
VTLVVVARTRVDPDEDVVASLRHLGISGGSVDICEDRGRGEAVVWLPVEDASVAATLASSVPGVQDAWLAERCTQWDGAPSPPDGQAVTGVKQVTFLRRASGMDRAQFAHHWSTVHAPLARVHHPALWRYRQSVVISPLLPSTPDDVDGVAELGMRLRLDFAERMYDSTEGQRIVGADVRTFLDLRRSSQLVTREYRI